MNKDINIKPLNDKKQPHGYWEVYYNDKLRYKCFYQNNKEVGYEEWYNFNGQTEEKKYYL
jgi:hypothetical protein